MDRIVETEIIDSLIKLYDEDDKKFFVTYRSLPINIYMEIEKLSLSKSGYNKELSRKAKFIAAKFHDNFK